MTRYREHWNPAHPAARHWIETHPEQRWTIQYRRAMVRHRLRQHPPRNRDGLRHTAIVCGLILSTGLVETSVTVALAVFAVTCAVAWPVLRRQA